MNHLNDTVIGDIIVFDLITIKRSDYYVGI
ncbi:hypothetical protein SAMN05421866_0001 [Chryseobacterium oranimense]|uniref:Uncharacterized protein n=1 Tax=Chryseobacterium oranimense TaxID=421058 RepID=A0A1M5X6F4_9FLAO|nr:hypothetical protein SAMN05421866_0001 [Chryseobacterium oranimense]